MDRAQRWQTIRAIVLGIAVVGGVVGLARFLDGGSDQPQPASSSTNDIATTVAPTAPLISTEDLTTNAASLSSTADAICAESEDVNTAQEDAAKNAIYDETGAHIISPAEVAINRKAADFRQKCASATRAKDFAAGAVKDRESDPLSFTIDMSVSVISGNPLTVSGTTNLPDGTPIDIMLKGDMPTCLPRCGFWFKPATVKDGAFSSAIEGPSPLISDSYTIDVAAAASTDNSSKHFRGPYVATISTHGYVPVEFPPNSAVPSTDVHFGMMIHYTQRILILDGGETHVVPCDGADQIDPGIGCDTAIHPMQPANQKMQPDASNNGTTTDLPPTASNPSDPYAAGVYAQQRAAAIAAVRYVYFATGCNVFSTDRNIALITVYSFWGLQVQTLGYASLTNGIEDKNLDAALKKAGEDGLADAEGVGACDYWQQHPEAVLAVRQEVEAARVATSN